MSRFPSGVRFEYVEAHSSNFTRGTWDKQYIVAHWWDEPARRPTFDGVVSWFRNPTANVSIQYMVEANRITQMIPESAMAWHAGNSHANRHGIGIEVNPRLNAGDYETTAILVAEIWRRRGRKLPLRRHREFTTTGCPGHLDVARVNRRANEIYNGATPAAPKPAPVLEGEIMTEPRDVWRWVGTDHTNDNATTKDFQLSRAYQRATQIWQYVQQLPRLAWKWRGFDYLNPDNPATKDHQIARAHQYSIQARNESRELKAMVKALAKAQDEGHGKILDAVENAERDAIKVTAAEVAAELEAETKLNVKED